MKLTAACFAFLSIALAAPQFSSEMLFPLERWHNHSSAMVETGEGDLLVCWYHGSGERDADGVHRPLHPCRHARLSGHQPHHVRRLARPPVPALAR